MSEEYYEASLDHPCASCKCLRLDDARLGGKVEVDRNGTSRVSFGRNRATVDNYRPADDDEAYVSAHAEEKMLLKLGYHRKDMFPNLSHLAKTASQGCEFCAMLRQDLLSVWSNNSAFDNVRARVENEIESKSMFGKIFGDYYSKESGGSFLIERLGSIDGMVIIYQIKCWYRSFTWLLDRNYEKGQPWLDSFVVCFRILDGRNFKKCSLSYHVSADSSDKCAEWLNIWRLPVTPETLRLERMRYLLDKAIRRAPPPTENVYLPTRLIDVGSPSQPTLRLVVSKEDRSLLETADLAAKRYLALSYCWGSREDAERQLKTTRDTLNDHLHHLPQEKLPQTIADAVELCRTLNIRYLWVDALCIIQGNSEDWAKESFEMSNVYANSFWTVCVLRGQSCLDGFLHPRKRYPRLHISFRSTLDASVSGKFSLSLPKAAHITVDFGRHAGDKHNTGELVNNDMLNSAWFKRGWTFQENQLSPRMILFGDHMFYVSCAGLYEYEDGSHIWYQSLLQQTSRPTEPNQARIFHNWYQWVNGYSARQLTVREDKLPALSAMARTFSGLYQGQRYLAGLWEADLHKGLLWTVINWRSSEDDMHDRKNAYMAPSWSWARDLQIPEWILGPYSLIYSYSCEFELCDAKLETEPGNPFGRVSAGYIILNAKMFRVPLGPDGRPNTTRARKIDTELGCFNIANRLKLRSQEDRYIADIHFDCDFERGKYVDGFPKRPISQLWMLYISSTEVPKRFGGDWVFVKNPNITFGLLIAPNENGDGFVKLGLFASKSRGLGGKRFWENIQPCEVKLV